MPDSMYHRAVGWRAPPLRRLALVTLLGVLVTVVLLAWVPWELAILGGWDVGAATFLASVGPIILRADGLRTERLAMVEDNTRDTAVVLVVAACLASLLSVLVTLAAAGRETGVLRVVLIALAMVTVVVSWTVVNTTFTLRYADLHYKAEGDGLDFGPTDAVGRPDFRDFAYVAFTIGMCYQVSDTNVRNRGLRRTVLAHALLSYVFGVVIVAAGINLVAGLIR